MSSENKDDSFREKIRTVSMSRRKFLIGTGAVAAGGALAACGGAPGPTPTMRAGAGEDTGKQGATATTAPAAPTAAPAATSAPAAEGARPAPSGTLTWLSSESFSGSFDPHQHTILSNGHIDWNCFGRLFDIDWTTGEILPHLATAYTVTDEGIDITLREGVTFHDGQPWTAKDAKFSIERMTNPEYVHSTFYPGQIPVTIVDDYHIKAATQQPLPVLNTFVWSPMVCSANTDEEMKARQNGTGPCKWGKYEGETVYYEAFNDYYKGPPRTQNFQMRFVGDPSTRLAALQKGEADIIERVPGDHVETIEGDPNLFLDKTLTTEMTYVCYKCTTPYMKNKALRQAVAHCVDHDGILNGIMKGYGAIPESHLSPASWPFGAPNPNFIRYDLEKAKAKLVEAGYPGGEGLPELSAVGVSGFYPNMKEYMEYISAECAKVGIKMKVEIREVAAWLDAIYLEDSCDLCFHGWMLFTPEPDSVIHAMYYTNGRLNFVSDPASDAAMDKEAAAKDPEERKKIIIEEAMPAIGEACGNHPIVVSMFLAGVNKRVTGYHTLPGSQFDLWDVAVA